MKYFLSVFLFMFMIKFSLSQDLYIGYIISKNSDTTFGLVGFTAVFKTRSDIKFYLDGKKVDSKIENLIGYGFIEKGKYHHFHKIKTHGIFGALNYLERVLEGKISVYITAELKSMNIIDNNRENNMYYKQNEYYIKMNMVMYTMLILT